jgi:hypothetical protein
VIFKKVTLNSVNIDALKGFKDEEKKLKKGKERESKETPQSFNNNPINIIKKILIR